MAAKLSQKVDGLFVQQRIQVLILRIIHKEHFILFEACSIVNSDRQLELDCAGNVSILRIYRCCIDFSARIDSELIALDRTAAYIGPRFNGHISADGNVQTNNFYVLVDDDVLDGIPARIRKGKVLRVEAVVLLDRQGVRAGIIGPVFVFVSNRIFGCQYERVFFRRHIHEQFDGCARLHVVHGEGVG